MLELYRLLDAVPKGLLREGKKGIEKESLRVTGDGRIARSPHPCVLGSALTHPHITTDYSEALLEFVTPPFPEVRESLDFLCQIHQFVYKNLDDELLWMTSMPCALAGENSIPIATYGRSNVGMMKHVYRRGLMYRYGGAMQAIAGVHFNYSLPSDLWPVLKDFVNDSSPLQEFISNYYFHLIRNFQRLGWLIPYLFGTSPAVCKSFLPNRPTGLAEFDAHTLFLPYATSLRMSDIGYKNTTQASLNISYNDLDEYVTSLTHAIETPFPEYEKIEVVVNGEYRQLNANILQIENEYYSFMRPKQIARSGEKPTLALKRRGVQYVELRALDVSAYDSVGVNENQLRFLEAFLVLCVVYDSPPMSAEETRRIDYNQRMVVSYGRDPSLRLQRQGRTTSLRDWAREIYDHMQGVCELLDGGTSERLYSAALETQLPAINDPECTPSAGLLTDMRANKEPFSEFAMRMSKRHEQYFKQLVLPEARAKQFKQVAEESLQRQREIEAADEVSFEEYLKRYFAQS